MHFIFSVFFLLSCLVLGACGEETKQTASNAEFSPTSKIAQVDLEIKKGLSSKGAGGVIVKILPENPTSTGCLQAVIQGAPSRSGVTWKVNDVVVSSGTDTQLCSDNYKRDDTVSVEVGTKDFGAQTSVSIGNSPPRIVDISSTPAEIYSGTDITVAPVAEDVDDDNVDFTYQWLINGEADPVLTEATLTGENFTKGDTVQVLIVPNDFFDDGPTYESYSQPIPNAAPRITSEPPQGITSLDYRYQVEVSDPDDNTFTYRLDEAPKGMTIDESSGLIEWPLTDVTPGNFTITIIAADSDGVETAQGYTLSFGAPQ
jgi:hypothetical protein